MLLIKFLLVTSVVAVSTTKRPLRPFKPEAKDSPNEKKLSDEMRQRRSFPLLYSYQSPSYWRYGYRPVQNPYYYPTYVHQAYPVIFPVHPVYAIPPDNPVKPPYAAPTYLPPTESTTMKLDDRFNGNDDRPIWDNNPSEVPTRAPLDRTTPPPLIHGGSFNHLSVDTDSRMSTSSPRTSSTTTRPKLPTPGPNECVWAIISCCSSSSEEVSNNCFEQLGCGGPFWDFSPCQTEFAKAAIASANNYFNGR